MKKDNSLGNIAIIITGLGIIGLLIGLIYIDQELALIGLAIIVLGMFTFPAATMIDHLEME